MFILTKRTRVGDTWITKYMKSILVDGNRRFGLSTCDVNEAMKFSHDSEINSLNDIDVWSKVTL